MSLTSAMSRITADLEAAQGGRLAGIAKIGPAVRRDGRKNKASLAHTMAAHRAATKSDLRDIFGMAAFTRGAAEEMIERFTDEREDCTNDLREHLEAYVAELRKTVGVELSRLTAARVKMAHREEAVRRVELKDLRRRVEVLLANSARLIEDFKKDRVHAGRVWEQHMRNAPKQRKASAVKAMPHKQAAKKRKHARA
jgi:hypothetical protein